MVGLKLTYAKGLPEHVVLGYILTRKRYLRKVTNNRTQLNYLFFLRARDTVRDELGRRTGGALENLIPAGFVASLRARLRAVVLQIFQRTGSQELVA